MKSMHLKSLSKKTSKLWFILLVCVTILPSCKITRNTTSTDDKEWDVIVIGGGPAGCSAAIASAREGAKTLLIEGTGMLGGMGTAGLMNNWCPFSDGEKIIYKGIAEKVYWEAKKGVPSFPINNHQWVPINTEHLKRVYDDLVTQSGAKVLFFSTMCGVKMKDKKNVDYVLVANKNGLSHLKAKVYVDCTGDGDLAAFAGADYMYGDSLGEVQSSTLCFSIVNINQTEYEKYGLKLQGQSSISPIHKILKSGKYPLITDTHFNVKLVHPTVLMFNAGHVEGVKSTDPVKLSDGIVKGRKIAEEMHRALKEECPEVFKDSYLSVSGSLLGVRESRRIKGDYVFTVDDWLARRSFPDEIGRNCYYIDIHKENAQKFDRYKNGESHGIPYRCLTPQKLNNVLVAGRCISTDALAYGSLRIMPACLVTGEAAGLAAALASSQKKINIHAVDVNYLRKRLKEEGQDIRD